MWNSTRIFAAIVLSEAIEFWGPHESLSGDREGDILVHIYIGWFMHTLDVEKSELIRRILFSFLK